MKPYIGITGFTDFEQVRKMLKVFKANKGNDLLHQLHVGVMMSYKTLNGIPSKYSKIFPPKGSIAGIFGSDEAFNCLHYADYDGNPGFIGTLSRAIEYGGIGIRSVQLDMIWPDPSEIMAGVHNSRKSVQVILQIGKNAFEEVDDDPVKLVVRLEDYRGVIHRVLLDKSMGRGLGMDAQALLPFARMTRLHFPELGIGVAGGLGPRTMRLAEPLVDAFPDDLSVDAQGQLCTDGDMLKPTDWGLAGQYLIEALKPFS